MQLPCIFDTYIMKISIKRYKKKQTTYTHTDQSNYLIDTCSKRGGRFWTANSLRTRLLANTILFRINLCQAV